MRKLSKFHDQKISSKVIKHKGQIGFLTPQKTFYAMTNKSKEYLWETHALGLPPPIPTYLPFNPYLLHKYDYEVFYIQGTDIRQFNLAKWQDTPSRYGWKRNWVRVNTLRWNEQMVDSTIQAVFKDGVYPVKLGYYQIVLAKSMDLRKVNKDEFESTIVLEMLGDE